MSKSPPLEGVWNRTVHPHLHLCQVMKNALEQAKQCKGAKNHKRETVQRLSSFALLPLRDTSITLELICLAINRINGLNMKKSVNCFHRE
jgi:hypothetical protein